MSQSFKLVGHVNLGSKDQFKFGADGISLVFQPGNTNIIGGAGGAGGAMGFGGVKGAFGFKLDTWYNNDRQANPGSDLRYNPDPAIYAKSDRGVAFGGFVYTDGNGVANTMFNSPYATATGSKVHIICNSLKSIRFLIFKHKVV